MTPSQESYSRTASFAKKFITVVTGIWLTWGGIHDIRALFRSLASYKIDNSDNGTVEQHKPW